MYIKCKSQLANSGDIVKKRVLGFTFLIGMIVSGLTMALIVSPFSCRADELLYQVPPKVVADLIDVPPTPFARLSPDKRTLLLLEQPSLPSIAEVSQPELRLAGLRINPKTNGPSRKTYQTKLYLLDLVDEKAKPHEIEGIPARARIDSVNWAPDGKHIAFTLTGEKEVNLWLADLSSGKAHKLINASISAGFYSSPYNWVSDGTILAKLVPPGRGGEPAPDVIPKGPIVQENDGKKRPARTDPNLLKNAHDEQLFDYYLQAQVAKISIDGTTQLIGKPDVILEAEPSPDAKHILVHTCHHPYSYKVGLERFPYREEVWASDGKIEKLLADNPLAEEVPIDFSAVPTGRRDFEWQGDADATVCWTEALDGGDPKREAALRDEVFLWKAPFSGEPVSLAKLPLRFQHIQWGTGNLALLSESWWTDRKTRTYIVAPGEPATPKRLVWDRSFEDHYSDPGTPLTEVSARGTRLIQTSPDGEIFLSGEGASPEGDRPFIDKLSIKSLESKRLWRSESPYYEFASSVLDKNGDKLLSRRESISEPTQYYLRKIGDKSLRQLTDFPNPNPTLAKVSKKLIQYQRADGVKLSAMLYLPPEFKEGQSKPLPMLMWAYPTEFKSKDAAGQIKDSPFRFVRVSPHSPLFALLLGYAVLDDPKFPIVGEGKTEPNDTYVTQLVAGAKAAVDEVVRLGVADRDRIAIGGHSYGAFTTANLLAHSDLFRAGIARSGAYNRTLTPFGFQAEERTFWQASPTYIEMSPFTYANKIDEPLLLIHGEADDNTGTYTIQSERMFEAMKGLGGQVRLVILPAETHGYHARESILHMFWEMDRWLDKYVKNAPPRKAAGNAK